MGVYMDGGNVATTADNGNQRASAAEVVRNPDPSAGAIRGPASRLGQRMAIFVGNKPDYLEAQHAVLSRAVVAHLLAIRLRPTWVVHAATSWAEGRVVPIQVARR
jgi:acyl-CoA synthetase (AMP-forming)/AMP-acid ligase II